MKTDFMNEASSYMEKHLNEHRREHIKGVIETAVMLADIYGADREKAYDAAFLHDIAKSLSIDESDAEVLRLGLESECLGNVNLSHGRIAACWANEKYDITDIEILDAIRYHTTSRGGATLLDKIVFVADTVEPGRTYEGAAELYERAKTDLQGVYSFILKWMIEDLIKKGKNPGRDTMNAYKEITDEQ